MTSNAPHDVVELQVGEARTLRLSGLGTAGYRWTPEESGDETVAKVARATGEAPDADALGASADEVFRVEATGQGVTQVRFGLKRPWEKDKAPTREHVVELRVH